MRFNIRLNVIKGKYGNILPCNYQYEFSSFVYRTLNEGNSGFTMWLHDKGYITAERKQFKLFTFSNLIISRFRINRDRISILSDQISVIVSFYPIEAIEAFIVGLFNNRHFVLGDKESRVAFEVCGVEKLPEPEFTSVMQFKTLSPIFVEEQFRDIRRTNHLSPAAPAFARLLHLNLLDKYRAFYGKEPDSSWPETQIRLLSEPKAKTITIKSGTPQETRVKGYMCWFELSGEPELLRLGYDGGFGRIGSQGFGAVDIL